jgi:hypothetical protein
MKASLVYCKQFNASRDQKVDPKKSDPPPLKVPDVPIAEEAKPVPKRRGRKPGSKKVVDTGPKFRIEEGEIIIDFS